MPAAKDQRKRDVSANRRIAHRLAVARKRLYQDGIDAGYAGTLHATTSRVIAAEGSGDTNRRATR